MQEGRGFSCAIQRRLFLFVILSAAKDLLLAAQQMQPQV
jgi:hypothetical protein